MLLAEELHEPRRDLPVVLIATVLLTMALFTALHVAVYWGLGGGSEAYDALPARHVARHALGAVGENVMNGLMVASLIGVTAGGWCARGSAWRWRATVWSGAAGAGQQRRRTRRWRSRSASPPR